MTNILFVINSYDFSIIAQPPHDVNKNKEKSRRSPLRRFFGELLSVFIILYRLRMTLGLIVATASS